MARKKQTLLEPLDPEILEPMLENSAAGFRAWLRYAEPHILNDKRKWIPFVPTKLQNQYIDAMLEPNKTGGFRYQLIFFSQPRRHGKSTLFLMFVLWLFSTRDNHVTQCLGNTVVHSLNTQYGRLKNIILKSPKLLDMCGGYEFITTETIGRVPRTGGELTRVEQPVSKIQAFSGLSLDAAFGDRTNLLWVSDIHQCSDMSVFNAWQASLLDSQDTLILIDSNIGGYNSPDHILELMVEQSDNMFCHRTEYRDLNDFKQHCPSWIDTKKVESLKISLLPEEFQAQILGQRVKGESNLFSPDQIKSIQSNYEFPVSKEAFQHLIKDKRYHVGLGLDRAKSLIRTSTSDATVLSVVLKLHNAGKEPNYILLDQISFLVNTDANIISTILNIKDKYGVIHNLTLENFEVSSLFLKLQERKIPCELLTTTQQSKNILIPNFYHIVSDGRLTIPPVATNLINEMLAFTHRRNSNGTYSFSHPNGGHDDFLDSLTFAVHSGRESVSTLYQLDSLICENKSCSSRVFCFLMGGSHILNACSSRCAGFQTVAQFHQNYLRENPRSDVNLADFYTTLVQTTTRNYRM